MKKLITGIVTFILLAFLFSCAKAKEAAGIATAEWHIGTTDYTSTSVQKINDSAYTASGTNNMQVFFASAPVAGTYKIVNEQKAGLNELASGEMAVEFNNGAIDIYLSTGTDNVFGTVTVNSDGEVTVSFPTIQIEHIQLNNGTPTSLGTTTADGQLEH